MVSNVVVARDELERIACAQRLRSRVSTGVGGRRARGAVAPARLPADPGARPLPSGERRARGSPGSTSFRRMRGAIWQSVIAADRAAPVRL
jgi:hypothetical protein